MPTAVADLPAPRVPGDAPYSSGDAPYGSGDVGVDLTLIAALLDDGEALGRAAVDELLERVRAWQRVAAWAEAHALQAVADFADACEVEEGLVAGPSTAHLEIGIVCGGDAVWGQARITEARALDSAYGSLRCLGAHVASGVLPAHYARAVLGATSHLSADDTARVEAAMLDRLSRHHARTRTQQPVPPPWRSWRDCLNRAVMRVDPDGAARARRRAERERSAWIRQHRDGTATIACTLPAVDATGVWQTLTAAAEQVRAGDGDQPRTLDQARVDAFSALFADLVDRRNAAGQLPTLQGRTRVEVQVHIDLATLLGLRDEPAHLPGHGPLDPELARILASDAAWRRIVTDPFTRDVLDVGRSTYTPGRHLRDFVIARHPQCTMPGCTRRAWHCQLDHITPWPRGETTRDNLHPLCQRDHNRKTHEGWQVQRLESGGVRWRSPHGLTVSSDPPPF